MTANDLTSISDLYDTPTNKQVRQLLDKCNSACVKAALNGFRSAEVGIEEHCTIVRKRVLLTLQQAGLSVRYYDEGKPILEIYWQ